MHIDSTLVESGPQGKTEKMVRDLEMTKGRLQKAEADLKEQLSLNQDKLQDNARLQAELRHTDNEIGQLYQETLRATKQKDALLKRLKQIDSERTALRRESDTIRSQAQSLDREIEVEKKDAAAAKSQAAEVRKEKRLCCRCMSRACARVL
jgi:chromosome segregation ATPase